MLLALAAVALIAADTVIPLDPLRAFGSAVYGGLEDAASSGVRWASGAGRLEDLERENARLRAELLAARRATPPPAEGNGYQVVSAHAVGFGRDGTVTIDAGAEAGVTPDMTVFDADGLVGRVLRTGPGTATVQLATASGASVGARLEGSREVGLVTGVPEHGLLRLGLLNPSADVKPGDRVVTLGSRDLRPFVPDVPIGTVVTVEPAADALTRTALVRPFARFTALENVTVVLGPLPDAPAVTDTSTKEPEKKSEKSEKTNKSKKSKKKKKAKKKDTSGHAEGAR